MNSSNGSSSSSSGNSNNKSALHTISPSGTGFIRPISAQPRRKSLCSNLAAIPEVSSEYVHQEMVVNTTIMRALYVILLYVIGPLQYIPQFLSIFHSFFQYAWRRQHTRYTMLINKFSNFLQNRSLLNRVVERRVNAYNNVEGSKSDFHRSNENSLDSCGGQGEERVLGLEDFCYVLASSHDPGRSVSALFNNNSNSSSNSYSNNNYNSYNSYDKSNSEKENEKETRSTSTGYSESRKKCLSSSGSSGSGSGLGNECSAWTSTGLMPQLLTLSLRDRWLIKRVSVRAVALEEMSVLFIDDDLDGDSTDSLAVRLMTANRVGPK